MAINKCKECGNKVSSHAKECPHCGVSNPVVTLGNLIWRVSILFIVCFLVFSWVTSGNSIKKISSNITNEPVIRVNIENILSDYKKNEIGADNKYKDHLIETSGTITSIKKDIMDKPYVTLSANNHFSIPEIQAYFNDSMNVVLGQLKNGSRLTVVCRIDGLMMNVLAKNCIIK